MHSADQPKLTLHILHVPTFFGRENAMNYRPAVIDRTRAQAMRPHSVRHAPCQPAGWQAAAAPARPGGAGRSVL